MDSTLFKGLAVLERLSAADTPVGVSALAAEFDLPKSNMHRTLSTLVAAGYAAKNDAGAYTATLKTWGLGTQIMARLPLQRTAVSFMHTLQEASGETVSLVVMDGDDSLYIHQISSSVPIRASSHVGERAPALLTVSGKTMLANLPDYTARYRELFQRQKSPKPPLKLNEYLAEAELIRENGYWMSQSVWRPAINSLAAVIVGAEGLPVGAIAITGPKERYTAASMEALIPSLLNACTNIGRALGGP